MLCSVTTSECRAPFTRPAACPPASASRARGRASHCSFHATPAFAGPPAPAAAAAARGRQGIECSRPRRTLHVRGGWMHRKIAAQHTSHLANTRIAPTQTVERQHAPAAAEPRRPGTAEPPPAAVWLCAAAAARPPGAPGSGRRGWCTSCACSKEHVREHNLNVRDERRQCNRAARWAPSGRPLAWQIREAAQQSKTTCGQGSRPPSLACRALATAWAATGSQQRATAPSACCTAPQSGGRHLQAGGWTAAVRRARVATSGVRLPKARHRVRLYTAPLQMLLTSADAELGAVSDHGQHSHHQVIAQVGKTGGQRQQAPHPAFIGVPCPQHGDRGRLPTGRSCSRAVGCTERWTSSQHAGVLGGGGGRRRFGETVGRARSRFHAAADIMYRA